MAAHHSHSLALGDGPATAAIDRMLPAGPVHLAPHSLLPLVEEGLVNQESAPIAGLQELKGPVPHWRKNPARSQTKDKSPGVPGGTAKLIFSQMLACFPGLGMCEDQCIPTKPPKKNKGSFSKSIRPQHPSSHHSGGAMLGSNSAGYVLGYSWSYFSRVCSKFLSSFCFYNV